jgi:predicted DNA-binding transcriptional regulator AlpA
MDHLITTIELSKLLKIQPHAIYMRKYRGISLPQGVKVGHRLLWPVHAVEAWLEQHALNK